MHVSLSLLDLPPIGGCSTSLMTLRYDSYVNATAWSF